MGTEDNPDWNSGDPAGWETYYQAWYQIKGAKAVMVEDFLRAEHIAKTKGEDALDEALKKVIELGLKVEASCWTVKWRSRRQTQTFEATNLKEYVTAEWYGQLKRVTKSIHEGNENSV